jgi:hypothetical protein
METDNILEKCNCIEVFDLRVLMVVATVLLPSKIKTETVLEWSMM